MISYMELAKDVYKYYKDHINDLSDDKRFHFATRIAAWTGAPEMYNQLRQSYEYIVQPTQSLSETIKEIYERPQTGRRNVHELRAPYFEKYASLYGAHLALFRVRHLKSVYGIDATSALYSIIGERVLSELRNHLLADTDALKVLSTFAVNFCYLLEHIIRGDAYPLPVERFYDVGLTYKTNDPEQLQLMIYLYTHCIIGDSNFYTRDVTGANTAIYHAMLTVLEPLIRREYDAINLDNKLEYLVCTEICHFNSSLKDRIFDECERSLATNGTFIVDTHNTNGQTGRRDFISSEHRNVLYIMSTTPYIPHSTLLR